MIRFEASTVRAERQRDGIGPAFQALVFELLSDEYRQRGYELIGYRGKGPDGAIDLSAIGDSDREILECKVCPNIAAAIREWKAVAKNLRRNLTADRIKSQFEPWFPQRLPLGRYVFCVTADPANESQRLKLRHLRQEIVSFFGDLAAKHSHLKHLEDVGAEVIAWNDFSKRLEQQKSVRFKWFTHQAPTGLQPFDDSKSRGGYRDYLRKIPYYSRAEHSAKVGIDVDTEVDVLTQLDFSGTCGVIVTGPGGVGKTRLVEELARIAHRDGWAVFRASQSLSADGIDELAASIEPKGKALIVLEYVETQRDFIRVIDRIVELNASADSHIAYVASVRASYYSRTLVTESTHYRVDLTPADRRGFNGGHDYNESVIRHILSFGFGEASSKYLELCGGNPALAVYVVFLQALGRAPDLRLLLSDNDFAKWVLTRLRMTFPDEDRSSELAEFVACLPLALDQVADPHFSHKRLFEVLAQDGWIEVTDEDPLRYGVVHDVLADRIVLAHISNVGAGREIFLTGMFLKAGRCEWVASALATAQRIVDAPEAAGVNWARVLRPSIEQFLESWRPNLPALVRSDLLSIDEKLNFKRDYSSLFDEEAGSPILQSAVASILQGLLKRERQPGLAESELLPAASRARLATWVSEIADHVDEPTPFLGYAVMFAPSFVKKRVLRAAASRPRSVQGQKLLASWLRAGQPPEDVRELVRESLIAAQRWPSLTEIATCWLNADGDPEVVQAAILAWPAVFDTTEQAQYLYKAWLNATKNWQLIEKRALRWIDHWADYDERDHLLNAWLSAGGPEDSVRETIFDWVCSHSTEEGATFLMKKVSKMRDLPEPVAQAVIEWCITFRGEPDSLWRFSWLSGNLPKPNWLSRFVAASRLIFEPFFEKSSWDFGEATRLQGVLCRLIIDPDATNNDVRNDIDYLALRWLRHPSCLEWDTWPSWIVHKARILDFAFDLLRRGQLSLVEDRHSWQRLGGWFQCWRPIERLEVVDQQWLNDPSISQFFSSRTTVNLDNLSLGEMSSATLIVDAVKRRMLSPDLAVQFVGQCRIAGHWSVAHPIVEFLTEEFPSRGKYWQMSGLIKRGLRDFPGAIADGLRAIQLDEDDPSFHYALGATYAAAGMYLPGLEECNKALVLQPNYPKVEDVKAGVLAELARLKES